MLNSIRKKNSRRLRQVFVERKKLCMRLQMHMKVIYVVIGCIEVKEVGFCGEKNYHHVYSMKAKKTRDMSEKKTVGRVLGVGYPEGG